MENVHKKYKKSETELLTFNKQTVKILIKLKRLSEKDTKVLFT